MCYEKLKRHGNLISQVVCRKIFSNWECKNIISQSETFEQGQAKLETEKLDKKIRETKVRHLISTNETYWIWDRINSCIMQTNQQFYNFDVAGLGELQLLEYDEGCFYDWHVDITANLNYATRKISIVVFLSNPDEYEGGQLIWDLNPNLNNTQSSPEQGSMVLFPSYQAHKVEPVTGGKRFTLVGWAHGNAFS